MAFDRVQIAKKIGEVVDNVRRDENRKLKKDEDNVVLVGTKSPWLPHQTNRSVRQKRRFQQLKTRSLKTARAWAMKQRSPKLGHDQSRTWARKRWKRWRSWAMRCRLEPMKKATKTVKEHLGGMINAIVLRVSNGPAESSNSRIKMVNIRARGFRHVERFVNAVYFYLGGLDLYPENVLNRPPH